MSTWPWLKQGVPEGPEPMEYEEIIHMRRRDPQTDPSEAEIERYAQQPKPKGLTPAQRLAIAFLAVIGVAVAIYIII